MSLPTSLDRTVRTYAMAEQYVGNFQWEAKRIRRALILRVCALYHLALHCFASQDRAETYTFDSILPKGHSGHQMHDRADMLLLA